MHTCTYTVLHKLCIAQTLGESALLCDFINTGNLLTLLPGSIGQLMHLEGLWLHGNQLKALPEEISALASLKQLSLSGNRLTALPSNIGRLTSLIDLGVSGSGMRQGI